jgi:hypothetical protein
MEQPNYTYRPVVEYDVCQLPAIFYRKDENGAWKHLIFVSRGEHSGFIVYRNKRHSFLDSYSGCYVKELVRPTNSVSA